MSSFSRRADTPQNRGSDITCLQKSTEANERVAAYPLDYDHQHRSAGLPDHRAHFRIPDPRAFTDNFRTLVDHHLMLESTTSLRSPPAFPIRFVELPQVELKAASRCALSR